MATPNPLETTYASPPPQVSKKTFTIAGILTTVFGLEELPSQLSEVACLWLLHPRLQTQACMEPIAGSTIGDWNKRIREGRAGRSPKGLIAVSFDQRNHGTREIDQIANEAWRSGNERHAQDMFSTYHGTATDTMLLMQYLSSYALPYPQSPKVTQHLVLGVSLGGHSAWHCLLHSPLITTAIIVIGCPDYTTLMTDRARLSKLPSWTKSSPPGSQFLGSKDFPQGLVEAVGMWDPAGMVRGYLDGSVEKAGLRTEPSATEKESLRPMMRRCLGGKRILNLSGGKDKMVPYKCGEAYLTWLKKAVALGGWFQEGNVTLEDIVVERAGHEVTWSMIGEIVRFTGESLVGDDHDSTGARSGRVWDAKM